MVFAADNNYVPQLTTTIYSAIKNANSDRFYDVIVLQQDIAGDKQERMWRFFEQFPNMSLRFLNVKRELSGYDLSTNNAHISIETYYRFLIQQLLPNYDKVLYLDSDIIIVGDIAKLYDIDLQDNLLGAVRDIDFLGNLKREARQAYVICEGCAENEESIRLLPSWSAGPQHEGDAQSLLYRAMAHLRIEPKLHLQ